MHRFLSYIYMLLLCRGVLGAAPIGNRYIEYPSDAEGAIRKAQIWSIASGPEVYLATNYGLFTYDGARIICQTPRDSSTTIRDLCYDAASGRLYSAGFKGFGWWESSPTKDMIYHPIMATSTTTVNQDFWRIRVAASGEVYAQTSRKILVYNPGSGNIREIHPGDEFRYLHLCGGRLYVQDGDRLCIVTAKDAMEEICRTPDRIMNLVKCGGRTIAAVERTGLMELKGGELVPLDKVSNRTLAAAKIFSMTKYDEAHLLVGTTQGGLFVTDSIGRIITDKAIPRLENSTVLSIAKDGNGDIWVGMESGIARIDNSSQDYYLEDSRLGRVRGIVPLGEGRLLIGANKGAFHFDSEGIHPIEGSTGSVWNVFKIGGQVFICHDQGLFGIGRNMHLLPIYKGSGVLGIARSRKDSSLYYCGTYQGIIVLRETASGFSQLSRVKNYDGFCSDIHVDAEERLWIRDRQQGFIRLTLSEALDSAADRKDFRMVTDVGDHIFTLDIDGETFFCRNTEAYHILPESGEPVLSETASGLLRQCGPKLNSIIQIGERWFYSGNWGCGVVRRLSDGSFRKENDIFTDLNPGRESVNLFPIEGGCAVGLFNSIAVSYGPRHINEEIHVSRVELLGAKKVRIVPVKGTISRIPFKLNSVRISTAGNVNGNFIEYRVSDVSKDWRTSRLSEPVLLSSLSPGSHSVQFRLISSPETACSIRLQILPPWYFRWWMFIVYLMLALLLAFAIRARYRKRIREGQLRMELKEKGKELANITFNNAKRNSQLMEIKERLISGDDVHKASELAKISNETVQLINGFLEDESDWKKSEEYFNIIYDGLLDKLKKEYPNISKTDLKICVFAKLNLSTKEIANIMNVSPRSVEMARYRLRKRLCLSKGEDIAKILKEL